MKYLLVVLFVFGASTAGASGRYDVTADTKGGVWVTDTKTGETKWCVPSATTPVCMKAKTKN